MYEAIVPAIPNAGSLLSSIGGRSIKPDKNEDPYYWPASLNAAMATLTKDFFLTTSESNKVTIDSLVAAYNVAFKNQASAQKIQNAIEYGQKVAASIFNWSVTDGGDQAYSHLFDPNYPLPSAPGAWVPTPPAMSAPLLPHWEITAVLPAT